MLVFTGAAAQHLVQSVCDPHTALKHVRVHAGVCRRRTFYNGEEPEHPGGLSLSLTASWSTNFHFLIGCVFDAQVLLKPLQALCSFQIQHGAQIHHSKEHLIKNGQYDKILPKNKRKIRRMQKLISNQNIWDFFLNETIASFLQETMFRFCFTRLLNFFIWSVQTSNINMCCHKDSWFIHRVHKLL